MTQEPKATDHDEAKRRVERVYGSAPWRRLWRRRVMVVDDDDSSFDLGPRTAGDLLGWSSSDLRCAPYLEFLHPDDRDRLPDAVEQLHGLGADTTWAPMAPFTPLTLRVLARDRVYWWTRWHVTLAPATPATPDTPDTVVGRARGVEYLAPDVTTGPPMGTWRWRTDTDTVFWSTELLDMFGFTVGPPASYDDFLSVVFDDDRDMVDRAVRRTATSGEPYVVDFRIPGRHGRERWFHATGRAVPAGSGRPGGMAGLVKYVNPGRRHRAVARPHGCG